MCIISQRERQRDGRPRDTLTERNRMVCRWSAWMCDKGAAHRGCCVQGARTVNGNRVAVYSGAGRARAPAAGDSDFFNFFSHRPGRHRGAPDHRTYILSALCTRGWQVTGQRPASQGEQPRLRLVPDAHARRVVARLHARAHARRILLLCQVTHMYGRPGLLGGLSAGSHARVRELDVAGALGEQRVVAPDAHVLARLVARTTLPQSAGRRAARPRARRRRWLRARAVAAPAHPRGRGGGRTAAAAAPAM